VKEGGRDSNRKVESLLYPSGAITDEAHFKEKTRE
jgi:hypothetical protein